MPRLAPTPLQLTEIERSQLQPVVKRHSTPQQIALRVSIILLAEEGHNHRDKFPPDAQFDDKVKDICEVYLIVSEICRPSGGT